MALFKFTAIDQNGKKIKGNLNAESSSALATQLSKKSLTIISAEIIDNKKLHSNKNKVNTFFTFSKKIILGL